MGEIGQYPGGQPLAGIVQKEMDERDEEWRNLEQGCAIFVAARHRCWSRPVVIARIVGGVRSGMRDPRMAGREGLAAT
ncbi:hypothetical protein AWB61_05390 [Chromobacterium sp. F49]|nr:hypothetical protein Cv017_22625 [Chromobacterium subtsugae]KZE84134.1 hypothetical protein AWB61_05390 [Chromobacterium sp. F49]